MEGLRLFQEKRKEINVIHFTPDEVIDGVIKLGIPLTSEINSQGWVKIPCPNPSHAEKVHDNCSININSTVINCFSCGYKSNLFKLIQDKTEYKSKQDILKFVRNFDSGIKEYSVSKVNKVKRKKSTKPVKSNDLILDKFNPNNFGYTKRRGFTNDFCNEFNIQVCTSGWFKDYIIIPVCDNIFEARKLKIEEKLNEFFNCENIELSILQEYFKKFVKKQKFTFEKGVLYKDGTVFYNDVISYIMKPKVLYAIDSNISDCLFNYDNLNRDETLYLVEGIGSVPKIWSNISKNVTTVFGSQISKKQISMLSEFTKIIYIPDYDEAGYKSAKSLMDLNNVFCIDIKIDDEHPLYVEVIKKTRPLHLKKYLYNNLSIFTSDFKKDYSFNQE